MYFYCCDESESDIPKYYCRLLDDDPQYRMHISRIKAVGKNYTSNVYKYNGEIKLITNEYININNINQDFPSIGVYYQIGQSIMFGRYKLIIRFDEKLWILWNQADQFVPIVADQFNSDNLNDPSPLV